MGATVAARSILKRGKAPNCSGGTTLAFIDLCYSGVANALPGQRSSWGGARNRADRVSLCLTVKQAESIAAAAGHALRLGLPLNRHVTLHLEKSGVAPGGEVAAIGTFLKLHRQFLASRGLPFVCVWVREDDDGDGMKGAHVHILMHVPSAAAPAVTGRQRRWLRKVTALPYRVGSLHTSRIGGTVRAADTLPPSYWVGFAKVLDYVLKGIEAGASTQLRSSSNALFRMLPLYRHGQGGRVIGKRCGWSENVGVAARRANEEGPHH